MKVLVFMLLVVTSLFAQEAKKPELTEGQKNQLYAVQHKIDVANRQVSALNEEYVKIQARAEQIKSSYITLQSQLEAAAKEMETTAADVFKAAGADKTKYDLDLENMTFVPKPEKK